MNYKNEDITKRAEESPLWKDVETQSGNALPYLLERYLLLENWKFRDRLMSGEEHHSYLDDMSYVHLLLAEAVTVLLSQEERIRRLEAARETEPECNCADWGMMGHTQECNVTKYHKARETEREGL